MVQAKLESKKRIGILGGTFDPAHIGHIKISKVAKKILKLDKIIWAITSKNPFKDKSLINIDKRIAFARKINLKNKFIEVKFYEKKIKSIPSTNFQSLLSLPSILQFCIPLFLNFSKTCSDKA